MITPTLLADYFARNVDIVKMQIEGLDHKDSLIQLPFRANCLNWVVGHLITNRLSVLRLLAARPPFDPALVSHYERESEPICEDGPGVLRLEELLSLLEQLQAQIAALLADITDDELDREIAFFGNRSRPVAEWLFFFYFHDTYHVGQTELLRQAAGKDDKII